MVKKEYTNQELAKIYLENEMKLQQLENEVAQLKKIINKRLAKQRPKKGSDFYYKLNYPSFICVLPF